MPDEGRDNRRLRDHPWIAAVFAVLAGLFVYSVWFAPHDRGRPPQNAPASTPVPSNR
jgi:hypothetical protein